MAELYKLIPSGFSFEKTDGYNRLPAATIGKYFEYNRGDATDLYVVKHYTKRGAVELVRGYVPTGEIEDLVELRRRQMALSDKMDAQMNSASEFIVAPTKLFQARDNEYAFVFAPCQDGFIGCGWYDHAATEKKGLIMAAFVVYGYGLINADTDKVFWGAAYKYLPYSSKLDRSDIVTADEIILGYIKEQALKLNNERGRVVPINGTKKIPDE